jgi:glutamate synthase domain-containing protein 3
MGKSKNTSEANSISKSTVKTGQTSAEKENEKLRKQIEELLKQLNQNTENQTSESEDVDDEFVEIRPNKYIKVISLNFGKLILSTEGKGRGKIYVFNKFGDVRNIVYTDLANIIHNQQTFAEQGRFFIADKNVIKNHGLIEYYDKFLSKEKIEDLLSCNKDQIVDLFKSTTKTQQEIIVDLLIQKIKHGEDVDLNKVDTISRIYGINIYEKATDYQQE